MEGFKQFKKVQCFKEGGTVQRKIENFEKRERKVEEKDDIAQDKKVVKKAFSIHDKQQHEEKTDLAKLNKGGRAKKEKGTVKKFEKASGEYGAKKTDADIKRIKDAKNFKPKKMADGGLLSGLGAISDNERAAAASAATGQGQITELEKRRQMEKMARAKKYLGPAQQSELINQSPAAAGLTTGTRYKKGGKACK